jgi:putative transcriptional regulator
MNIEKIAKAIEADAGEPLPDLRQAFEQAKARIGRVNTPEQMLVRQAREASGASQSTFAVHVGTPVAALRDREQGRFAPSGAVLCLLRLIIKHHELTAACGVSTVTDSRM